MTTNEGKNQLDVIAETVNLLSKLRSGNFDQQTSDHIFDKKMQPIIDEVIALAEHMRAQANAKINDVQFIVEQLGIGTWKWDLRTNALEWDDNMYKLYGCDPNDFSGAYDAWESSLSEESKAKAIEEINAALNDVLAYDTTFQVIQKQSNRVQEIRTRAFLIKDDNGTPIKMWGINLDRSREAALERELKKTSQFLEQTGAMAKVGGWELDLKTGQVHMTRQTQIIDEIDENYSPPEYSTGGEWGTHLKFGQR